MSKKAFAFVRHPIPYYESTWKYLKRIKKKGRHGTARFSWYPLKDSAQLWHEDFNVWIDRMLNDAPLYYTRLIDLYVGPEGGEYFRYVGRTENLNADFLEIMRRLGYHKAAQKHGQEIMSMRSVNKSDGGLVWESGLQDAIIESEKSVIERFYQPSEYDVQLWSPVQKDLERGFPPDTEVSL